MAKATSKETAAENFEQSMNAPEPEMVTIRLFKDGNKYKDDLTVGYNGKFYKIQRGVKVQVPAAVAEIIEQSLEQDGHTADLINQLSRESDY